MFDPRLGPPSLNPSSPCFETPGSCAGSVLTLAAATAQNSRPDPRASCAPRGFLPDWLLRCFTFPHSFHAPPSCVRTCLSALTHAALGFLVEESGFTHVIEFHADNYVGAFLPRVPPRPTPAPVSPPPSPSPTLSPTPALAPSPPPTASPTSASSLATPAPTGPGDNSTRVPREDDGRWGALGPGGEGMREVDDGDGIHWDNAGQVRHSKNFDPKLWTSSTFIAKITGLLFNDIAGV